jgi:thymidylate synthase (FAD)
MDEWQIRMLQTSDLRACQQELAALKYELQKKPKRQALLDHGYVDLYDWMGDDLRIVNAARQSFGQESTEFGEAEEGLIKFLMRNRHGTPFEAPVFTFNVKAPIFVAREWFRHRISSYNEYSGRYSKMINEFYVPDAEQIRSQTGKPGNYTYEPMDPEDAHGVQTEMRESGRRAFRLYENLLEDGVAKEVARMILPVNGYTQWTWTVNLRSLLNFISLRSHKDAMWEISQYSEAIEQLIEPIVPVAYRTFNTFGRVAP